MIAVSEGEPELSGEEDSAVLPPSGMVAMPESDPGLPRWSGSSGDLHHVLKIQGWTIGFSGRLALVLVLPFFPEVHEELTSSWTAPFTTQNCSGSCSQLTTLNSGTVRGYREILPVPGRLQCYCVHALLPPGAANRVSLPGPVGIHLV